MKYKITLRERISSHASTFLVPALTLSQLTNRAGQFGNIRNLLHFYVHSQNSLFETCRRQNTGKTLYQDNNQDFKRIHFRPFEGDWEKFRLLALSLRVSMSRLFVILVLFLDVNERAPTKYQQIILKQTLLYEKDTIYILLNRMLV